MPRDRQPILKIAQIAPLAEAVPPRLYGGTERVVAHLADSLVDLGHDVTLFASGDARTAARLVSVREQAIRLDPRPLKSDVAAHLTMLHQVRERADEFDVLHFHIDLVHFPLFERFADRTVTTCMAASTSPILLTHTGGGQSTRWFRFPRASAVRCRMRTGSPPYITESRHGYSTMLRRIAATSLSWGVFRRKSDPIARSRSPSSRRCPSNSLQRSTPWTPPIFERVQPRLNDPNVEFVGEIGDEAKNEFLGGAAALIFPIDWPEPFGLVMIEAMACGTPVIAWDVGSVREIVDHGVTGFVVRSIGEAVAAVRRIDSLDRARIRATFERRFSVATMSKTYLELYSRLCRPAAHARESARERSLALAADHDGALRA